MLSDRDSQVANFTTSALIIHVEVDLLWCEGSYGDFYL